MCGIVGLFLKDPSLEPRMGEMLTGMLVTMSDRGPDSAGVAIYGAGTEGEAKLTVQSGTPDAVFPTLAETLSSRLGTPVRLDAERHACGPAHESGNACQPPAPPCARWRACAS
jgi:predicted NBD/HSP70 family sugar kinase